MNAIPSSHSPASSVGSLPASPSASDTTFSVMLKGIRQDVSLSDATALLASLFKLSPEQAASLLALPSYTVKKSLPHSTAVQYQRAIEAAGGVCEVLPDTVPSLSLEMTSPVSSPETPIVPSAPAPVSVSSSIAGTSGISAPAGSAQLDIDELKERINIKTLHFVLLTVATAGIYPVLWLTQHHETFNRVTKSRTIDMTFILWMAACIGISLLLRESRNVTLNLVFVVTYLAGAVLHLVWAFRAKKALQDYVLHTFKIDLKMNPVYTFFFHVFYINYCINDLPEVWRRHQILHGQTAV